MGPRFHWTWQVLGLMVIIATHVLGERRGFEGETSPRTFSAPEQALFGSCTSEDCVLGPAQGRSYFLSDSLDQVDTVSSTSTHNSQLQERTSDVHEEKGEDDTEASRANSRVTHDRFGRPSFVRPR